MRRVSLLSVAAATVRAQFHPVPVPANGEIAGETSSESGLAWQVNPPISWGTDFPSTVTLTVHRSSAKQSILGFGPAFTDTAAWNFQHMNATTKATFLENCFGETGAQWTLGRVTINSADYSFQTYACKCWLAPIICLTSVILLRILLDACACEKARRTMYHLRVTALSRQCNLRSRSSANFLFPRTLDSGTRQPRWCCARMFLLPKYERCCDLSAWYATYVSREVLSNHRLQHHSDPHSSPGLRSRPYARHLSPSPTHSLPGSRCSADDNTPDDFTLANFDHNLTC